MTKEYTITGMTCTGCLAKVKRTINGIEEIQEAAIQLEYPQAKIISDESLDLGEINLALKKVGNYAISEEYQETVQAPLPKIKKQEPLAEKSYGTAYAKRGTASRVPEYTGCDDCNMYYTVLLFIMYQYRLYYLPSGGSGWTYPKVPRVFCASE